MIYLIQSLFLTLTAIFLSGSTNTPVLSSDSLQLNISHYKIPCQGEGIQLCYLVSKNDGENDFFYNQIEGFKYEWGYNYKIIVEKIKIEKPMADASSLRYKFKKQISKEKVSVNISFELPLQVNAYRMVKSDGKNCLYFDDVLINTNGFSCDSLARGEKGVFQHINGGLRLVSFNKQ